MVFFIKTSLVPWKILMWRTFVLSFLLQWGPWLASLLQQVRVVSVSARHKRGVSLAMEIPSTCTLPCMLSMESKGQLSLEKYFKPQDLPPFTLLSHPGEHRTVVTEGDSSAQCPHLAWDISNEVNREQ